jgi:hypothetical protein
MARGFASFGNQLADGGERRHRQQPVHASDASENLIAGWGD